MRRFLLMYVALTCSHLTIAFAKPADAVVRCDVVISQLGKGECYSGAILEGGLILTAKHCTYDREKLPVTVRLPDGRKLTARFLDQSDDDQGEGAALLKLPQGIYPTLSVEPNPPFEKSPAIPIYVLGYPMGCMDTRRAFGTLKRPVPDSRGRLPKLGIVKDRGDIFSIDETGDTNINVSAPITTHGYSGGPVLNMQGKIIGIVSAGNDKASMYVTHGDIVALLRRNNAGNLANSPPVRVARNNPEDVKSKAKNQNPRKHQPDEQHEDGRPNFLFFTQENCTPCRSMEKSLVNSPEEKILEERYHAFLINIDKFPGWADRYNIESTPVLLDSYGRRIEGKTSNQEIVSTFSGKPTKASKPKQFDAPVDNPNNRDKRLAEQYPEPHQCPPGYYPTRPSGGIGIGIGGNCGGVGVGVGAWGPPRNPAPRYRPPTIIPPRAVPPTSLEPTPIPTVIVKGDKGDPGPQGEQGIPGEPGEDGRDINPAIISQLRNDLSVVLREFNAASKEIYGLKLLAEAKSIESLSLRQKLQELQIEISELAVASENSSEPGPQGERGSPGERGPNGLQGIRGERGPAGKDGRDGESPNIDTIVAAVLKRMPKSQPINIAELKQELIQEMTARLESIYQKYERPSPKLPLVGSQPEKIYYDVIDITDPQE